MKKIVIGIICLLLIAAAGGGGYYFLSQKKSSALLNEFAKGGNYSSLGWEVHLPEFHSHQIKGGRNPYVDFGDQEISIIFGGKEITGLEHGRLVAHSKKEKTTSLIFDQVIQGKIIYTGLVFDLTAPQSLTAIHVAKIQTKPTEVNTQMTSYRSRTAVTLEGFSLDMSEYKEFIPDQINLNLSSIQIDQQTGRGQELVIFKNIHTQINSQSSGDIRNWTYLIDMEGISGKVEGNQVTSKPLHIEFSGVMNNIKISEITNLVKKIEGQPGQEIVASLLVDFLGVLNPIPKKFTMTWSGLEVNDSQNNKKLSISPLSVTQEVREDSSGFNSVGEGKLDYIAIDGRKMNFLLKNLSFKGSAYYKGKKLADFYRSYYSNLLNLLALSKMPVPSPGVVGFVYLNAITRYPSTADVEFKVERLEVNQGKPLAGQYTNIFLTAKMHDQGFEYLLGTDINQKVKGPLKEIKNAKIEFKLGGEYPWSNILEQMNKIDQTNPEQTKQFALDLLKHRYGYFMELKADAGDMNFMLDTGIHAKVDMSQMLLTDEEKIFGEKLIQKIGAHFIDHGELNYAFKIEKLSSLKVVMEKIKQGSSGSVYLLGPYAKINDAKDTLEIEYLYKEGQSLVNGVPDENIGKIIEELKYKLLPFSRPAVPQNNYPNPTAPLSPSP